MLKIFIYKVTDSTIKHKKIRKSGFSLIGVGSK